MAISIFTLPLLRWSATLAITFIQLTLKCAHEDEENNHTPVVPHSTVFWDIFAFFFFVQHSTDRNGPGHLQYFLQCNCSNKCASTFHIFLRHLNGLDMQEARIFGVIFLLHQLHANCLLRNAKYVFGIVNHHILIFFKYIGL